VRCNKNQELFLTTHLDLIKTLAKTDNISMSSTLKKPAQSATAVANGMELYIPLDGLVDLEQERLRMQKRVSEIKKLLRAIDGKLSNQNFLERAPEKVISKEKINHQKLSDEHIKLMANLEILK
jgi:valyl-tRNA synthetase